MSMRNTTQSSTESRKTLWEATTKETLDTSNKEITEYLNKQVSKWTHILNEDYRTDGGIKLELHSSGRLEAAIATLAFIRSLEKKNDK